ncbi:YcxB family protein [Dyella sp.]|uniref:YcxB family protein n=1 Tax=Dyella sp. TaxID=1869338 RepID=UPI002D79D68E|nr:YcxB family protein [Dyella sp.]HET7330603.1 YcxB family protein [Dyella sp.]
MELRASLTYSPSLIRQAVWAFWRRVVGLQFPAALILITIGLVALLRSGDRSWLVGVVASVLILGTLFMVALFLVHYRNSTQKLRAMGAPQAELIATHSSLSLSSGAGTVSLPWSSVSEVWQFPTFWLLLFSKNQFSTLPLADVSTELRKFMLQRVGEAGGKIS